MEIRYFSLPNGKMCMLDIPDNEIKKSDRKFFEENNLTISIERLNTNNIVYYVSRQGEEDSEEELIHISAIDETPKQSFNILRKLAKELL